MSLALTAVAVAALAERTEGWVAGVQLAALARQGSTDIPGVIAAFAGSHRNSVDYLADEVRASTASWERICGPRPSPALTPSRSSNTTMATTSYDDRSGTGRRVPSCRLGESGAGNPASSFHQGPSPDITVRTTLVAPHRGSPRLLWSSGQAHSQIIACRQPSARR